MRPAERELTVKKLARLKIVVEELEQFFKIASKGIKKAKPATTDAIDLARQMHEAAALAWVIEWVRSVIEVGETSLKTGVRADRDAPLQ
jgi:hypothetical protein